MIKHKINHLILFAGLISASDLLAQDVIRTQNGKDIKVTITRNTTDTLTYKEYDNSDGPLYVVPKTELMEIRYKDGSIELTSFSESEEDKIAKMSNTELYQKGYQDAEIYYEPNGYGALAVASVLFNSGYGTNVVMNHAPVDFNKQAVSNKEYLKYSSYKEGYQHCALKKRRKREFGTVIGGVAVVIVGTFIYVLTFGGR